MFIVTIQNGSEALEIHNEVEKLAAGKVVKGVNTIDSFTFTMLPSSPGFDKLHEFTTLVHVYNTNKARSEFFGRVLYMANDMDEEGRLSKEVTCESYFGFLCDSRQAYVDPQNWTVQGLLQYLIDRHNEQVEPYKRFTLGTVTVTDPNDNLYCGIQRKNTWEAIKEKLLDVLGGELQYHVTEAGLVLDYVPQLGKTSDTAIVLSRNMKSIQQEKDPTAFVSRLIPLGCKLKREETTTNADGSTSTSLVETEHRLGIEEVNGGLPYIVDEEAEAEYGIHYEQVEWNEVTEPSNLLSKGRAWLVENNRVKVKYSITALDLSLLGLDLDDYEVHNYHPVQNPLLQINDVARVIKKNLDICEEVKSSIEVGENFKTLTELQLEQAAQMAAAASTIQRIEGNYVDANALSRASAQVLTQVANTYVSQETNTAQQAQVKEQFDALAEAMSKYVTSLVLYDGANLDEIVTPNNYAGNEATTAGYTNCPVTTATPFVLEVIPAGGTGQLMQRITTCSASETIYHRFLIADAWTAWT